MGKLAVKLGDPELASALIEAGLTNPRKIRDATDEDLEAIKGIGPATKNRVRAKFPKSKR